jgi:H+/Cl- antiporter ClcA
MPSEHTSGLRDSGDLRLQSLPSYNGSAPVVSGIACFTHLPALPPTYPLHTLTSLARAALLALAVAALAGSASALFLWLLHQASALFARQHLLIWGLPVAGAATAWVYQRWGQAVERGNNLLIDEIHQPQDVVPLRMAPLILLATVVSHLFGASVGREGTAVQMGGALADQLTRWARLDAHQRRIVLQTGVAAGFASVFGTPLAGAVFALEVITRGRLAHEALWPCLVAAVAADQVTAAWGIQHERTLVAAWPTWSLANVGAVLLTGLACGAMAWLFARVAHQGGDAAKRWLPDATRRAAVGGLAFAAVITAAQGWAWTGLGTAGIDAALRGELPAWGFAAKAAATLWCLAFGFKGGEVTPLFFIGAGLGLALEGPLHMPAGSLSALGFVALFAGAAKTPLACTLLAVELFGASWLVPAGVACTLAFACSGRTGIYKSQRSA